jgi:uncharacterized membrane protein YfcA
MFDLSVTATVVCVAVVFIGAAVQGSIGIGLGLISAPVLAIVDPAFIPATITIAVLPLTVLIAWADREHVRRGDAGLAVLGRLPGVVVGALIVAAISETVLSVLVGLSVLIAVAASLTTRKIPLNTGTLLGAGAASGFMGTTTGVGGPPMALTYQHSDPATMRATISAFFFVGALMSTAALWVAGEVGERQLELSLLLVPAVVAGGLTARALKDHLQPHLVRPLVLTVCAASAVALLLDAAT